jgi:hypothetical protein
LSSARRPNGRRAERRCEPRRRVLRTPTGSLRRTGLSSDWWRAFAVAGRERGFAKGKRRSACVAAARSYREAMGDFAQMRLLDMWYSRLEVDEIESGQ